jgi:hypothetical protein
MAWASLNGEARDMPQQQVISFEEGADMRVAGKRGEPRTRDLSGRPNSVMHLVRLADADETRQRPSAQTLRYGPLDLGRSPRCPSAAGSFFSNVHVRSGSARRKPTADSKVCTNPSMPPCLKAAIAAATASGGDWTSHAYRWLPQRTSATTRWPMLAERESERARSTPTASRTATASATRLTSALRGVPCAACRCHADRGDRDQAELAASTVERAATSSRLQADRQAGEAENGRVCALPSPRSTCGRDPNGFVTYGTAFPSTQRMTLHRRAARPPRSDGPAGARVRLAARKSECKLSSGHHGTFVEFFGAGSGLR